MKLFEVIPIPTVLVGIVLLVNVLTEVTKKLFDVKKSERVVTLWAVLLTVCVALVAVTMQGWTAWWCMLLAAAVGTLVGAIVAYAAMFGYDELYNELLNILIGLVSYVNKKGVSFLVEGTEESTTDTKNSK